MYATSDSIRVEITSTTNVVRHLVEICRRDLHLARGYSSSALRRTHAVELALAVPSVLEMIDKKELCLQAAADIQTFLNRERGAKQPYSIEQKKQLVETCRGLSTREIQIELSVRNPKLDFRESKKFVSKDRLQITHTIAVSIEDKLTRLKQLLSHVNPYMNREELIDYMAENLLEKMDPIRRAQRADARDEKKSTNKNAESVVSSSEPKALAVRDEVVSDGGEIQLAVDFDEVPAPAVDLKSTRYVGAEDRRDVQNRNRFRGCGYVDPVAGRRCGSQHQIQFDHVVEFSRGGPSDAANLEILCAKHNRFRWRQGAKHG